MDSWRRWQLDGDSFGDEFRSVEEVQHDEFLFNFSGGLFEAFHEVGDFIDYFAEVRDFVQLLSKLVESGEGVW